MNSLQRPHFARNVYLVNDIIGALAAIDQTASHILQHIDTPEARAYAAGHRAALEAMAEVFHVSHEVTERMVVKR